MGVSNVNVYSACDKAIQAMNRENLEAFTRLKGLDFDRLNIIQEVKAVYDQSVMRARKRYYEVGFEAYLLAMAMCEVDPQKAQMMAEMAITEGWVGAILTEPDFMTLYRFDTEADRKAYKLAEALEIAPDRSRQIDQALKAWSQQVGQYAINVTDYAVVDAFLDAGVKEIVWDSEKDQRVCHACYALDGKKYSIDNIPRKPHPGCRCRIYPVID